MDIRTLRHYRRTGRYIPYEDRVRLCKDDSRRVKVFLDKLVYVKWISIALLVILFIRTGGALQRGYTATGSEIFVPVAAYFAWWLWTEEQENKKTDD